MGERGGVLFCCQFAKYIQQQEEARQYLVVRREVVIVLQLLAETGPAVVLVAELVGILKKVLPVDSVRESDNSKVGDKCGYVS